MWFASSLTLYRFNFRLYLDKMAYCLHDQVFVEDPKASAGGGKGGTDHEKERSKSRKLCFSN